MFNGLLKKIFGTSNQRKLKNYIETVARINELEAKFQALSDQALTAFTADLKTRCSNGESLHALLPEAFALCREAGKRVLNMRHFDVQLIGGMALHDGRIAEMKTGEGKTLVATLPAYLNALTGKGVHIITVNDYLAKRDSEWMGRLHQFLGLSVGVIVHGLNDRQRQASYRCDITYGTNNEFGFDYLRDNMKFSLESMAQRELNFAIVDEVDSILIDEARTPLIISGPSEESTDKYISINRVIPGLNLEEHYKLDEKSRQATLTEEGVGEVEKRLGIGNLYDVKNIDTLHHIHNALRAHTLFKRDVDYVVVDGKVQIVDEFTGRILPGRRWSDGLHQAVEAKENVPIESENQTLASITYQNYFRMYQKLSGMTGTADTEATEFDKIYNLQVVVIPPHRVSRRVDLNDVIYKGLQSKFSALVEEIKEEHQRGRPILIGTVAIEKSEIVSQLLKKAGIPHNVLNAKHHEREAEIIAQAGRLGAITVSTNMAGRGTDILLGGNPEFLARAQVDPSADPAAYENILQKMKTQCRLEGEKVVELGGLYVIGTERHESRRIDNQLRGRCGRQGDPGQTKFYLSLEDDLMRIFGAERIQSVMSKIGMKDDEVIEHSWITRAIEGAQKRVEGHNFEIRKNVLEYDDVMNQQRHTVYALRKKILANEALEDKLTDLIDETVSQIVDRHPDLGRGEIDPHYLATAVLEQYGIQNDSLFSEKELQSIGTKIYDAAVNNYNEKKRIFGESIMQKAVRFFMLQTIDELWKDHLLAMDHLRDGIGLRGYGQKDPKQEYKREGFGLFGEMMSRFAQEVVEKISKVEIEKSEEVEIHETENKNIQMSHGDRPPETKPQPARRPESKPGRNEACFCGSGKKYKKCHGSAHI